MAKFQKRWKRQTTRRRKTVPYNTVKRAVMSIVKPEKKYYDLTVFFNNVSNSGQIQLLSEISAGDDGFNRQGLKVNAKSLYIQGTIQADPTASLGTSFRVIVFMDKQNQGIDPTISNLLPNTGTQYAVISPLQQDFSVRYKILYNENFTFDNYKGNIANIKKYIKLNDILNFTNPTSTGIYKNAIYVVCISDRTTNVPDMAFSSRIGFYDM